MLRCDTDILHCLDWNIQNCLLREDQGGYLKSQCVSVEEPPKTNILNVTSISANVCSSFAPLLLLMVRDTFRLHDLKKKGGKIIFCQQTLSHHNLIWHKKSFMNLSKHFYFKTPLDLCVLHSLKLITPNVNDVCNSTVCSICFTTFIHVAYWTTVEGYKTKGKMEWICVKHVTVVVQVES